MTDEELIAKLRNQLEYWNSGGRFIVANRIEELTAENARFRRMMKTMVPLSADGESVFIDGVGDVELDFDGKLASALDRIAELLVKQKEDHDNINIKAEFIEATMNQLAIADANVKFLTEGIRKCFRTTGDPQTEAELIDLFEGIH